MQMTQEERDSFFEQNGYWPTEHGVTRPRKPVQDVRSAGNAAHLQAYWLRGWREPLHWQIPPLFAQPGLAYELLGHAEFCQQVKDYWQTFRDIKVEAAKKLHTRWAIKQILRKFELHVRGFRAQEVSSRTSKLGHGFANVGVFTVSSDELVLPELLVAEGRLVKDMDGYLRAYGVRPEDLEASEQLALQALSARWGVKTT